MANKERQQKISIKLVLETIISMNQSLTEQFSEIRDELKTNYATKNDLLELKEELLAEIRPIARALDTDATTIISHGKRITRLEKQVA